MSMGIRISREGHAFLLSLSLTPPSDFIEVDQNVFKSDPAERPPQETTNWAKGFSS
jgi:hypothetical protein